MSQEQVLKTLASLGLTRLDSQVYIYLAKKGPQKGKDLTTGLKIQKQQLYRSLKNLESKGIVSGTLEHPARFSVISFEKVVDIFVKTKIAEAQRIQENKNEIIANWQALSVGETSDSTAKFNIIEGRGPIYAKILQMMRAAKNQLSTISTITGLLRADQFGLFESGFANQVKPTIRFRALTGLSEQSIDLTKNLLKGISNAKINFEGRIPDLGLAVPQLVIRDDEEILFFITPQANPPVAGQEDTCLWTDCKSLVQVFITVFKGYWHNSTNIYDKITEIESGKLAAKTQIVENAEEARQKYDELLIAAEREILMTTSAAGLIDIWKDKTLQSSWTQKSVSVKIMVPITTENFAIAQELLSCCKVKHVPLGYLGTTIIDGNHLFQFESALRHPEKPGSSHFGGTLYNNDIKYVEKTRNMLNELWANSQVASTTNLELIMRPEVPATTSRPYRPITVTKEKIQGVILLEDENLPNITESRIIDRVIHPQKYCNENEPNVVRTYGSYAQALVHPPSHLKLPDLMFHPLHLDKHSTHGAEDAMMILLWLNTSIGYSYVPMAVVTDNPEAIDFWRKLISGFPVEQNVILVKKDEFQIRVHANSFFIVWTMPISMQPYSLPPSCILIEGTGNIKPGTHYYIAPSGFRVKSEHNYSDAFVTYLHPDSKYSGPGTDGVFIREAIMDFSPP